MGKVKTKVGARARDDAGAERGAWLKTCAMNRPVTARSFLPLLFFAQLTVAVTPGCTKPYEAQPCTVPGETIWICTCRRLPQHLLDGLLV